MGSNVHLFHQMFDWYHSANDSDSLSSVECENLWEAVVNIKRSLEDLVFKPNDTVHHIIPYQQEALHQFSHLLELEELPSKKTAIVKSACSDIFDYLLIYFYPYIYPDKYLPHFYLHHFIEKKEELIGLQIIKIEQSGIQNNLTASLGDYLNTFKHHRYINLNYQELVYLQDMLLMLSAVDFNNKNAEALLAQELQKVNFNHLLFFRYLQGKIQDEFKSLRAKDQKEEFLRMKKIEIPNAPVVYSCYKAWPSLQELQMKWIEDELVLVNRKAGLQNPEMKPGEEKIHLDISVAQLACILKCFYEEAAHYSVSVKSVLQLFTQKVTTKRQTEISYKSLSKCYYGVEQSTAAAVLALLERMTSKIRKTYFS